MVRARIYTYIPQYHFSWHVSCSLSDAMVAFCKLYAIHTVHCYSNTHHFNQQMHSYYILLCYTIQSQ
jgi:hypothetical protein